jgi:hypothetical protein
MDTIPIDLFDDICRRVRMDTCILYPECEVQDACSILATSCGVNPQAFLQRSKEFVKENYILEDKDLRRIKQCGPGLYHDHKCRHYAFKKYNLNAAEFGAARVGRLLDMDANIVLGVCSDAYLRHVARLPSFGDTELSEEGERLSAALEELEKYRIRNEMSCNPQLRAYIMSPDSVSLADAVDAIGMSALGSKWWGCKLKSYIEEHADGFPLNLMQCLHSCRADQCVKGSTTRLCMFSGQPWLRSATLAGAVAFVLQDSEFDNTEQAGVLEEFYAHHGITMEDIQEHAWTEWSYGEYRTAIANVKTAKRALAPFFEKGMMTVWYDNGFIKGVGRNGFYLEDIPWKRWYDKWTYDCIAFTDYSSMAEEALDVLSRWEEVHCALVGVNLEVSIHSSDARQYILLGRCVRGARRSAW